MVICGVSWYVSWNDFTHNGIESNLKRAAQAENVEEFISSLGLAIENIEREGLVEGNSGLLVKDSSSDIGIWYGHIKEVRQAIKDIVDENSTLAIPIGPERLLTIAVNTLRFIGIEEEKVAIPLLISLYPNQGVTIIGGLIALIVFFACGGRILKVSLISIERR